jgi:hypothetical protein
MSKYGKGGKEMNKLLINSMFIISIAVLLAMGNIAAYAEEGMDLSDPVQFPWPPNNHYGTYEPSITANGKTIYFAQFSDEHYPGGNPDNESRDIYVSHKVRGEWTEPVKVPYPISTEFFDTEPMISPDGRTMIFQSSRPGSMGRGDLWISRKDAQTDEWGPAENMGYPFNTIHQDHCLILTTTTSGEVAYWASTRPNGYDGVVNYGRGDIFASKRSVSGAWSKPWNIGPVANDAGNQCRFVPGKGNLIGVVTDHDPFHHQEYLVRFDPTTQSWTGPRIFAGWNYGPEGAGASDGCGNFTADGRKWIWSSGRNLGEDYNFPGKLEMYWVYTEAILDYYEDETGLRVGGRGN